MHYNFCFFSSLESNTRLRFAQMTIYGTNYCNSRYSEGRRQSKIKEVLPNLFQSDLLCAGYNVSIHSIALLKVQYHKTSCIICRFRHQVLVRVTLAVLWLPLIVLVKFLILCKLALLVVVLADVVESTLTFMLD